MTLLVVGFTTCSVFVELNKFTVDQHFIARKHRPLRSRHRNISLQLVVHALSAPHTIIDPNCENAKEARPWVHPALSLMKRRLPSTHK